MTPSRNRYIEDDFFSAATNKCRSLLGLISTACYYGCYAFVIYRTITGHLSVGDMAFLAGAIAGTSTNIQAIFSTFSGLADQALFLGDLIRFFSIGPQISAPSKCSQSAAPHFAGIRVPQRFVQISRPAAACLYGFELSH